MPRREKCKICDEIVEDVDHIDVHPHIEIIDYLYDSIDNYYRCNMCDLKEETESTIKKHVFDDHDKEERYIQLTIDYSSGFFA